MFSTKAIKNEFGEHLCPCPYCGTLCHADWCDVGVGMVQCGPYHCDKCDAYEIGPYDKEKELTERERKIGWYEPNTSKEFTSGNVLNGQFVPHQMMKEAYEEQFTDNPDWFDKQKVDEWYMNHKNNK